MIPPWTEEYCKQSWDESEITFVTSMRFRIVWSQKRHEMIHNNFNKSIFLITLI